MNSLFLVVLGLSLLVDLALGAWAGANFAHFAKTWGLGGVSAVGVASPDVAHFLGWVLGTCLIGFAAVQGIAFHWTRRDKDEGPQLAIVFGCWLVVSSLATFAFASAQGSSWIVSLGLRFLVVDGLRGAALTLLGFLALRTPSVVRELRLPGGARQPRHREERLERPRPERRDDRSRRRDERHEGHEGRGREDRGRSIGPREGRGRDDRPRHASNGHVSRTVSDSSGEHVLQRGDAPPKGHAGRRREEPPRDARPPTTGHRLPPRGGAAIVADRESRAVAEARRMSPESPERPLTVVVKGTPERIRALTPDEGGSALAFPVSPPCVSPSGTVSRREGVSPLGPMSRSGGGEVIAAEDGGGRRRRRRRRRGGAGSAEPLLEGGASSADYDDLDEPVVAEREIEERDDGNSGEGQEGASAVRGRNRGRRRRSGPADPPAGALELGDEPETRPGRSASAVEALDMLRRLEPAKPDSPASPRVADDRAFGRTYRPAGPRRAGAPRHPQDG